MNLEMSEVFPTLLFRVRGFLSEDEVKSLLEECQERPIKVNSDSNRLVHTKMIEVLESGPVSDMCTRLEPLLVQYGELLLGQELNWSIASIWVNKLHRGGHQTIHNHANSVISAVIYLKVPEGSPNTVFHRPFSSTGFILANYSTDLNLNRFNSNTWSFPDHKLGDLVMFPSFLLHSIPENLGASRISLALNAIPDRMRVFDYEVKLAP